MGQRRCDKVGQHERRGVPFGTPDLDIDRPLDPAREPVTLPLVLKNPYVRGLEKLVRDAVSSSKIAENGH